MGVTAATARVHDPSAALCAHHGQHRARHAHHAPKIDLELALGLLHRRELRRAGNAETGVIEQYIDAPLGVEHRLNRRGDGRFVRHVRRHMVDGRAAAAFFVPGKLVHRAAVRGKVFRCRRADAGAAAGHDGDLSHGCGLLLCE